MMNGKLKKPLLLLMLVAMFCMVLGGSAYARKGDDDDHYDDRKHSSRSAITTSAAVSMIVKGFQLNIDHIRFIKEPKASDYFTRVKDTAPYAQDFIIAHLNGLDLPRNIDPAAKVTREQFSHWLMQAISTKGDFAWIEIYIQMTDAKLVTKAYMDSVQKVLIAKIATLDSKKRFNPKHFVNRGDATVMLNRALTFVKNTLPIPPVPPIPENPESTILKDIRLTSQFVSNDLIKVTVSATAPHPGYGIDVSSIQFRNGEAVINYRVVMPDPAAFYPQVIADVKADAYIPARYTPVLGQLEPSEPRRDQAVY